MSYATNEDIQTRLGPVKYVQLTDDENSGSADETRVTQAREFAEAEVDSYLAPRHAVPVETSSDVNLAGALRALTVDLAVHRLYERKPPMPDEIKRRREGAIEWLLALSEGTVVLPSNVELAGNPGQGVRAVVTGKARILTAEELADL